MNRDEDFKLETTPDGKAFYTNLEKICKGLPEFGPLWCYICRKEISDFGLYSKTGFFSFEAGRDIWFKVFHDKCYYSKNELKTE